MNDPFVYVGTWTIKPGKLEDAKRFLTEHSAFIEEHEPRMIAVHEAGFTRTSAAA